MEVIEICEKLEVVVTSPMIRVVASIHICTNNFSIAQQAGIVPNSSSREGLKKFKQIADSWLNIGKKITV